MNRVSLRQILEQNFNLDDLNTICFDLGIDFEILGGDGKSAKAKAVIEHCENNGKIEELKTKIQEMRPRVDFPVGGWEVKPSIQFVSPSVDDLFNLATEKYTAQNYHKAKSLCQELEKLAPDYPGLHDLNNAISDALKLENMSRRERIKALSGQLRQKDRTPRVWLLLVFISLLDLFVDFLDSLEWIGRKITDIPFVKKFWEFLRMQIGTLLRVFFD